jgi:predicted secreted protein
MNTAKYKTVKGIQSNETKQKIRDIINGQIIGFAKQNTENLNVLTLPSTEWMFEKGSKDGKGLIDHCIENNLRLDLVGIEGSPDATVFKAFKHNAPPSPFKKYTS